MLELIGIYKAFGSKTVADNISLNVADGELLAILGASGCGKSTLLNIAAGLVMPDSGEVRLHGTLLNPLPPEKRRIALMFQDFALLPHLNAWQNVAFPLKMQGIANSEARRRALAMLAEVGLANEQERPTQALSGGEQQRVALARALVAEPRLLLLDEAFPASIPTCAKACANKRWRTSAASTSPPFWSPTTPKKPSNWPTTSP